MKYAYIAVLAICAPVVAFAETGSLLISPTAAFSEPDGVADNIKAECNLPTYQAEAVRRQIESQGIKVGITEKDEIPPTGKFLQLRIVNAVSSGNAFLGHRKQVVVLVKLFENGKELAKSTLSRDSRGGFGAGFKGSCAVLERCADTLGKDVAEWLKPKLAAQTTSTTSADASAASDKR